ASIAMSAVPARLMRCGRIPPIARCSARMRRCWRSMPMIRGTTITTGITTIIPTIAAIPPMLTDNPMNIDDFVLRALVAAAGIALLCGPLGAVLVWRPMAYFGDALSHSALLGIALGLAIGAAPHFTIVIVCAAIALALSFLEGQRSLAIDTLLGIMAHGALAGGLVALS